MSKTWRVRRWAFLLVFILGSGSIVGCAFQDRHVTLTPPTTIAQASSPPSTSPGERTISVARPQDLRPNPTIVGNVSANSYGMTTAQVHSNTDIPTWVANSIIQGLERSGFHVERSETVETAPTPVVLDIAVSRVFTEHFPGLFRFTGKGDVAAQVEVYKDGRRILRRTYSGKSEETKMVTTNSANEYQGLLDSAMKDFLNNALPDLVRVLDRTLEGPSQGQRS